MKLCPINGINLSRRRITSAAACFCLVSCFLTIAGVCTASSRQAIRYEDIPAQFCAWLNGLNIARESFDARIAAINQQTDQRELRGEYDHLIFFLLQSSRFTNEPKIEPAVSAYEFINKLPEVERAQFLAGSSAFMQSGVQSGLPSDDRVPQAVTRRISSFLKALNKPGNDERLNYFSELLRKTHDPAITPARHLQNEYARAMRFLYQKEFASRTVKPEELAGFVASLYQNRGHSTDTQIEANFAVHTALAALKAQSPDTTIKKVLIVGPGLDFAPRTDLIDLFGPQSYQPFAVADALLSLKLADVSRLQIHCVDINERVIAHLQNLPRQKEISLSLLSGIKDTAAHPLTDDYKTYFRELGKSIRVSNSASALEVPLQFAAHLRTSLHVRPEIVNAISADRLNIITERYQNSPQYDLVIVTNVFPYFSAPELLFALTNIAAMTADGGYLIHNELQTVISQFATSLGLPLQQARTVMIASGEKAPLFDGIAIHRKHPN